MKTVIYPHSHSFHRISVISGGRGAGKTTFCRGEIERWRKDGFRCAGVLQPGRFNETGVKTGFSLVDVATGAEKFAGSDDPGIDLGTRLGKWTIDDGVFRWANESLASIREAGLIVVDELGPLEFRRHEGLTAAFDLLREADYHLALVVIRPENIADFSALGFRFDLFALPDPPARRTS